MKVTQAHYLHMKNAIAPYVQEAKAHRESLKTLPEKMDVEKRLRWDLSYRFIGSKWVCDNLYSYCNDDHIDTALRKVIDELGV
jgi:hypothetical protein